jgi:uncharacterized protein YjbI with pentapeptide repeats
LTISVLNCLAYLDLTGCKLDMFDFYHANFRGANLQRVHLRTTNLEYAVLVGANLEYANLEWPNVKDAERKMIDSMGGIAYSNLNLFD